MKGREEEKRKLQGFLAGTDKACMVYGLRRIGKSYLIQNTLKDSGRRFLYFECVEASISTNLRLFCSLFGINPALPYATFLDAFRGIGRREEDIVVVIDEYQNLAKGEGDADIDSLMQVAIDQAPDHMKIIICGSYVTAMKKLLDKDNPLFGRFRPIIHLQAMDYLDSALFYQDREIRERIAFYSVFGGCPYINDRLKPEEGLRSNIVNVMIEQDSPARNYIENQLFKEIKKIDGINDILSIIANGKRSYSEIQSRLTGRSSSYAADRLAILENMEVIRKVAPINDPHNKKKARYEIADNLIRFYYAYIFPNKSVIPLLGGETFFESYISKSLDTFISYRFEGIAREYFSRLARHGQLHGILNIGIFYYDDPDARRNGESDVALRFEDGYDIFEVKYLEGRMSSLLIDEERRKILDIQYFKPRNIGFISSSGFEIITDDAIYIDGNDIYEERVPSR